MSVDIAASGRFAHRAQRAEAKKTEIEQRAADAAKHPRKGWTETGQKVAGRTDGPKVYRLVKIEPIPRPTTPIRGIARAGVTGGYVEGAKAENAVEPEKHSLHRDSGSLISRVKLALEMGRKEGIGDLRLECREMALRILASNPAAAAELARLEKDLRMSQYDLSQYS